ncbi:DNA polymerase IV [Geothermobacter hydrogeniphilus]|uniref:DNA polymerase IV n=1 Tax=Geothermobacter hydrogeniphilus TaxID=1969733 RepID=A0A2K2HAR7_9BACT|nr:DNA polymerase IV [Geothermobacter hydrogeniphilus]
MTGTVTDKTIIHCDMDAFFASVEQLDRPELAGRAVLVGGSRERGVVSACSYQARPFGVRSGMAMSKALARCPGAVVLPVRMERYREVSRQVFSIFSDYSDLIEPLSIDEAFLDVSGCLRLLGSGVKIAEAIRHRVRRDLGLPISAGVAPNKFLAKLASEEAKPNGLLEILSGEVDAFLLPLDIGKLWGVGRVMAEKLRALGIDRVSDLRGWRREDLCRRFGREGARFYELARGIDPRPVDPGREIKSIGAEETFSRDLTNPKEIRRQLLSQAEKVARRVRKQGLAAMGLMLKIKYADFSTRSRSHRFRNPAREAEEIWRVALELLKDTEVGLRPVRLTGIYLTDLVNPERGQQELFCDPMVERRQKLICAIDELQDRFGSKATRRATLLEGKGSVQCVQKGEDGGE